MRVYPYRCLERCVCVGCGGWGTWRGEGGGREVEEGVNACVRASACAFVGVGAHITPPPPPLFFFFLLETVERRLFLDLETAHYGHSPERPNADCSPIIFRNMISIFFSKNGEGGGGG